ncbi:MAG: extracellular solute-binding protein [bacterium]
MVTLKIWLWGGMKVEEFIRREINVFNTKFPGIEITPTIIPWRAAWDSIVKAADEEKGPDILQIGSTWNGTLADLGILKNITRETGEADITKDMFAPAAWASCCFPNTEQISSLPWYIDVRTMYYRADLFRELEVSPEDLDNWTSFEKTCEKIKSLKKNYRDIGILGVSGQTDALLLHNVAPWIWGAGGDFLTPDGKKAVFNSQKALKGLEFYISLVNKMYIPVSALRLSTTEVARIFFIDGGYVTAIPGPITDYVLRNPDGRGYNADIVENCLPVLFPAGEEGRFVFLGGSNLAITSFSQHPQEVWEFIKSLISYESQISYPVALDMFPSLQEAFNAVFIEENPELERLKNAWKYGRAFPNLAAWGAIETLLIHCFGKIFARVQEGDYDMSKIRTDLDRTALDVDTLLAR